MPFEVPRWDDTIVPMQDPWGVWMSIIVGNLNAYEEEIRDECGDNLSISQSRDPNAPWEIILTAKSDSGELKFRCYMSDHHADARLVIDDFFPSVEDWINHPSS